MTKGRLASLLVILVLALVAAGCGGDDSSSEATEETTVEETISSEETTVEETTEASGEDTSSSGEIDLDDLSGECQELASVGAKFSEAFESTGSASGDLSATADLFDELVDAAPDEIKEDMAVLAEGISKYAEALQGVNLTQPSAEDIAKLQEITQSFDSADLQQASTNIQAWVTENCSSS